MRFRRVCTGLVLLLLVALAQPATAGSGDNPAENKNTWRPNAVDINTYAIGSQDHRVIESFSWTTPWAMEWLDCPRVSPCDRGMWEQELRFTSVTGEPDDHWCDINQEYWNDITFLPSPGGDGGYHDNDPSGDEFTWGFHTDQINEDWTYSIDFHCKPNNVASIAHSYTVSGQLGHCHLLPTCSQYTTYDDEFVTFIPKRLTHAPDSNSAGVTLGGNPGFEGGFGSWTMLHETGNSRLVCDGPSPKQGSCYVFIQSEPNDDGILQLIYDVNPTILARAATYSEFHVRCPSAWNSDDCWVHLVIAALGANGSPVGTPEASLWRLIPPDDSWDFAWSASVPNGGSPSSANTAWPDTAVKWRFRLIVKEGDAVDADLHQQGIVKASPEQGCWRLTCPSTREGVCTGSRIDSIAPGGKERIGEGR